MRASGFALVFCTFICLFFWNCAGARSDLPLLDNDFGSNHFSYIVGFDVLNSSQRAAIDDMTDEANAKGMKTRRILTSWADLNPEENLFDLGDLEEQMSNFADQGYSIYISVTSMDSEGVIDVPERFRDDESASGLNGDWVNDLLPDYIETLTRVIGLMKKYNGYAISLANEPQFYFEDNQVPEGESSYVQFLTLSRDHIHSISDDIAVTVTLANYELDSSLCVSIIALSDVVTLNLYGRIIVGNSSPSEQAKLWRDDLITAESQLNSKSLILQEMGLSTDSDGSSESLQADYIETVTDYMTESNQLRVMYWFLLHDPSDAFLDISTAFPGEYVSPDFVQQIRDDLSGLGMCRLTESGCTTKASWASFLSSLEFFYSLSSLSVSRFNSISTQSSTSFTNSYSTALAESSSTSENSGSRNLSSPGSAKSDSSESIQNTVSAMCIFLAFAVLA